MEGDLTEGFLRYQFGGLVFGGAYFRNLTVYKGVGKSVIWVSERASVLQKCLSSQLPMQYGNFFLKKIETQRCNVMNFEAYSNKKIKANLGQLHNPRES